MAPKGLDSQRDLHAEALESNNKANEGINLEIGPDQTNFEELRDAERMQERLESLPLLELIADSETPLNPKFREDIAVLLHEIAAYCLNDSKPDSTQREQAYKAAILHLMSYFAFFEEDIDHNSDTLIRAELDDILEKLTPQHGNEKGHELNHLFVNKIWTLVDGIDGAKAGALNGIILVAIKDAYLNHDAAQNESVPSIATTSVLAGLGLAIPKPKATEQPVARTLISQVLIYPTDDPTRDLQTAEGYYTTSGGPTPSTQAPVEPVAGQEAEEEKAEQKAELEKRYVESIKYLYGAIGSTYISSPLIHYILGNLLSSSEIGTNVNLDDLKNKTTILAVIFAFFPPRGLDNFSLLTDHTLPEQTKYYLTNYIRNITFSRDELTWDHSNHDLDLTDSAVREALKHMCEALKRITGDHTSDIDTVGNWKGKTYSSVYQSILDYIINCIQVFDRSYPGTHLNDL